MAYLTNKVPDEEAKKESKRERRKRKYKASRKVEIQELVDNKTFKTVDRSELPSNPRIFASRFINILKKADHGMKKKSRIVAQNYGNEE